MLPNGLTFSVINRASLGDGYVRVRDSGLITAVAQFLYDEAALLGEMHGDAVGPDGSMLDLGHGHSRNG